MGWSTSPYRIIDHPMKRVNQMSLKQNLALTDDDLNGMSIAGLTALYNELNPTKLIKKFSTKSEALTRVAKSLDAARATQKSAANSKGKPSTGEFPEHVDMSPRAKKEAAPKAAKVFAVTVSSRMRQLIRAGKTNAQIWEILQPEFDLPDSKKGYAAWYRSDLRKKGEAV